mmetsp:Transcript_5991/g.7808  ORF Transcript_5991/g.7808 Transcript_5991/m.7808 type:complete len:149 (-) Transcript_5991:71-517(-)
MGIADDVVGLDVADPCAVGAARRVKRNRVAKPAKTCAFQIVSNGQINEQLSQMPIFQGQAASAGVYLAGELSFAGAQLLHQTSAGGVQDHGFSQAIAIVKQALAQRAAKAISGSVHDQVAGEPEVLAGFTGKSADGQGHCGQKKGHQK